LGLEAPDHPRAISSRAATISGARNLFRFKVGRSDAAKSFHPLIQFETQAD